MNPKLHMFSPELEYLASITRDQNKYAESFWANKREGCFLYRSDGITFICEKKTNHKGGSVLRWEAITDLHPQYAHIQALAALL